MADLRIAGAFNVAPTPVTVRVAGSFLVGQFQMTIPVAGSFRILPAPIGDRRVAGEFLVTANFQTGVRRARRWLL
jgi:hypothetical protein